MILMMMMIMIMETWMSMVVIAHADYYEISVNGIFVTKREGITTI